MKKIFTFILACLCVTSVMATPAVNGDGETPQDYTSYIINPSFENGTEGWTITSLQSQGNDSFEKKAGSKYMEKWTGKGNPVGSAKAVQTIKSLPTGKYRLTVGAQNLDQSNTSAKKTGVYIYAGSVKTTVYTPDDYSVEFNNTTGTVEIGFVASNAQGNWIAVDNFRLYYLGEADKEALVASLGTMITKANTLLAKNMISSAKEALQTAKDAAQDVVDGKKEYASKITTDLSTAISNAEASVSLYTALSSSLTAAKTTAAKYIGDEYAQKLNDAIADAEAVIAGTKDYSDAIKTALDNANTEAKASATAYTNLNTSITNAEKVYADTKEGAADFKTAIDSAKAAYQNKAAKMDEIEAAKVTLDKAILAFNIANATAGTGTAPKVTVTHKYVATGATQALVRATSTGSNILERGVCWSTHREPTVLDERTTKSYSLNGTIFHIEGLTPSTVYYARPYVINKTYTVVYGEERKIVTHPMGNCTWSWNEGAPTAEANTRCRDAVRETIEYFNEWTGINGFKLTGNYGADTPTADCSYGGWMRIGPSSSYQAIGTVLHETGHGVGVGTSSRWWDENVHSWKWYGREANDIYGFLENKEAKPYTSDFCMVGDQTHGWGSSASYDWFVNGADKDKHTAIQYIGGCCLLYGLFIDGLCPTSGYSNGISGYTYNFDSDKKYYIMCKDAERGLGTGVLYNEKSRIGWKPCLTGEAVNDSAAWTIEYDPVRCYYSFKNVGTGKYLSHASSSSSMSTKALSAKPQSTELFQLMPDRKDVTVGTGTKKITTHGYWFTWVSGSAKAMGCNKYNDLLGVGGATQVTFDYTDKATTQQWIIISEDEIESYRDYAISVGIETISLDDSSVNGEAKVVGIYTAGGTQLQKTQSGMNVIRYSDGTSKKIWVR